MPNEHRPLDEFEAQLAALRPAASRVDRDALLYEAGRAAASAAPRRANTVARWLSPTVTAASLALAATFAALWWNESHRPAPQVAQPTTPTPVQVVDDEEEITIAEVASPQESYLHLRQVALREGVDAWPRRVPVGTTTSPTSARSAWPLSDG